MKNIIIGFFGILFLILTGLGVSIVTGKTMRQNELDATVSAVISETLQLITKEEEQEGTYVIEDDAELIADTIQNILIRMDSNSTYEVTIYTADKNMGLLDVEVTQYYKQPFKVGKVSVRKTAIIEEYKILNQTESMDKNNYYVLTFQFGAKTIKQFAINEGATLSASLIPSEYSKWVYNGVEYTTEELCKIEIQDNMIIDAMTE